ncbi:MAG: NAD(P)/FAD-dependent oxidoreductase [Devosia sp.]
MPLTRRLDIAVAGAGPAGLATALYLHRAGHSVTLFERFDEPGPVGSGLMLQPTGQAVLADLGVLDAVAAVAAPIDRLIGTEARSGRTVLDVRYAALGPARAYGVHRAALFDALHDAVRAEKISFTTGFAVSGAELEGGRMALMGLNGKREGFFDLVVDALGSSSPLRKRARFPATPRALHYGALWTSLPWPDGGFDAKALTQRYDRASVMIGVMPTGRREAGGPLLGAFFWSLRVAEYEGLVAGGIEPWKASIRDYWPETAPLLDQIASFDGLTLARYAHHTLRLPTGERIAFVGDSAHATSPQLGQGANMALLDAKALAMALEMASSLPAALALYGDFRRWHVRLYQSMSAMLTPMYQSDSRILPVLRDMMVSTLGRLPPVQKLLAAMVGGYLLQPLKRLGLG